MISFTQIDRAIGKAIARAYAEHYRQHITASAVERSYSHGNALFDGAHYARAELIARSYAKEGGVPLTFEEDFESGVAPEFSGDWFRTDSRAHSGAWCLRGADITHDQQTVETLVINLSRPHTFRFYYAVSCEDGFDFFRVYIDETAVLEDTGEVDWTPVEFELAAGEHTIEFSYEKDSIVSAGEDTAFIDEVRLIDPNPPSLFTADAVAGSALVRAYARGVASLDNIFRVTGTALERGYASGAVIQTDNRLQPLGALGADEGGYAEGAGSLQPMGSEGSHYGDDPDYAIGEARLSVLLSSGEGLLGTTGGGEAALEPLESDSVGEYGEGGIGFAELRSLGSIGLEGIAEVSRFHGEQPSGELSASGHVLEASGAQLVQPRGELEAHGAGRAELIQPRSVVSLTGTLDVVGRAALVQPRASLQASGTTGVVGHIGLEQPSAELVAYGAGRAELVQPQGELEAAGQVFASGRAELVHPRSSLVARGIEETVGHAALTQPASELGPAGLVMLVQPRTHLAASGGVEQDPPTYGVYAINLENRGVTTYEDFPIHTVVRYRGTYFGVGPEGLYRLEGTKDEGENIRTVLDTGLSSFGRSEFKRLRNSYVLVNVTSDLLVAALTGDNHPVRSYPAGKSVRGGLHTLRSRFGRGVKSRLWGVRIEHAGEEPLEIHSIELIGDVLGRKVG